MDETYQAKDVAKITKMTPERVRELLYRGYIKPSIKKADGPGTQNIFSRNDLYGIKMFDCLVSKGFQRKHAAKATSIVIALMNEPGGDFWRGVENCLYVALFQREKEHSVLKRKDGKGATLSKTGEWIPGKSNSPGIRIIKKEDLQKSFETLFLKFDDHKGSDSWDYSGLEFGSVIVLNIKSIKRQVDKALRFYSRN